MQESNSKKIESNSKKLLTASNSIYYYLFINILIQTRTTDFLNWFNEQIYINLLGQPIVDEIIVIQKLIKVLLCSGGLDNQYTQKLVLVLEQINESLDEEISLENESNNHKVPRLVQLAAWALNKNDKNVPPEEQNFAKELFKDGSRFPVPLITEHKIPLFDKQKFNEIYGNNFYLHIALEMLLALIKDAEHHAKLSIYPIHLAVAFKVNISRFVEKVDLLDRYLRSALHWACIIGNLPAVKILLSKNIRLANGADDNLKTPLHYAVESRKWVFRNC